MRSSRVRQSGTPAPAGSVSAVAGVAAGPARLVGHLARLDRLPDGGEPVGADAVGDELGQVQGRRHPVRVDDRVGRALGGPGVERDALLEERLRERECRHLDLERGRGPARVVRGETLGHPAVGDEAAVEPGVGRLVEHDRRCGVIGDLDARGAAVEQGGVPARGARDCLLHGEWRAVRALCPWRHADERAERRQGLAEQGGRP